MKKLFCLLLCGAVILSFAGCGKKKTEKKYTTEVDVEYYVRQGQLPECGKYSLGESVDKLTADFDAKMKAEEEKTDEAHDDDGFFYFLDEQEKYTGLRTGSAEYCFKPADRDKGISCIVSFDAAFGFEAGTISIEVREALSDYSVSESTGGDGLPFLSTDPSTEYLTYKFADRAVTFAFYENALCGTAVYEVENWSLN